MQTEYNTLTSHRRRSAAAASIESVVKHIAISPHLVGLTTNVPFDLPRPFARRRLAQPALESVFLLAMKRFGLHSQRVNHASIGAFAAIASFGPWRGHILVIGSSAKAQITRLHGCFPSTFSPEEELELMARCVLPRERRRQQLLGPAIFSGSYFPCVFHIANTIAAT